MAEYQLTVTVRLPEKMEQGPLEVLSGLVLGALHDAEVDVRSVQCGIVYGSDET